MDSHLEPPSLNPSPDTPGLDHIIGHNAVAPTSTPGPVTMKDAGVTHQAYAPYGSSPAHHGIADFGNAATAYPVPTDKGAHMQPRPYSTPETSPSIAPPTSGLRTRSNARPSRSSKPKPRHSNGNRVSKAVPTKKTKKSDQTRHPRIGKPLSELAKEYPDIAIADMAAFVHRPREARLYEVAHAKKEPGKVKRPMNSFMLYRKAYNNLAKVLSVNRQQILSQVCGDGWRVEPQSVIDLFDKLAKTEKENHDRAHPGYKFTPNKSDKKPTRARAEPDDGSALDDPDSVPVKAAKRSGNRGHSRHGQVGVGAAPASILETYHPHGSPTPGMLPPSNQPIYAYQMVGEVAPLPYDNTSLVGTRYYPPSAYYPMSGRSQLVEDAMVRETPSPAAYGGDQDAYPGGGGQYPPIAQHVAPEEAIDPSLVVGPGGVRYDDLYGEFSFDAGTQWPGQEVPDTGTPGLQESMAPLDNVMAHDPQLGYLKGDEDGWQVEEIDGQHPQLDSWPA